VAIVKQNTDAKTLIGDDFELSKPLGDQKLKDDIEVELNDLIGMATAKEWFLLLKRKVTYVQMTGDVQVLQTCLSVIITGNPGTGKTRFAEILCRFLVAYGLLPKQVFVARNANELKAEHVGGTTPKVQAVVAEAMGGCLFLDEAHGLAAGGNGVGEMGDQFSKEVIKTLLTEVENNRTSLMVVLAGYKNEMEKLMRMDPGLPRRFQARLDLPDCTF
jgi:AAA+ superfamily predicted ATPase